MLIWKAGRWLSTIHSIQMWERRSKEGDDSGEADGQHQFRFESPKGRCSSHVIEDSPHYGLGSLWINLSIIRPTLELQKP